jgi:CrcB protein
MERFLLICTAGAVGTGTRYLIGLGATKLFGPTLPLGTLTVNLVGCFFMGLVMALAASEHGLPDTTRLVLATGFMGGLTTYSAFNFETTRFLFTDKNYAGGALYFFTTAVGCVALGLLGALAGRRLAG